ncbi:SDR family NAD(P)-dependent oxidoreductase [Polyangium sorediatum]|uniref:SDR family NAD(P)-dependent oxidoreductase n=1 Tax=Polyangium sorediatum TaxID=889274 RepID=A0ABT6NMS1_9BACT|nr:SDR family NAD(P)-dependent oxidoreductase [Polyangium sorediatum]MDI1429621.1 SDR family NAD(P)-dependent oxidoreductase [Polyangium sorediatum]
MSENDSQVWFITGSSRGLGRALALAVLAAGHHVVATARKPADLEDLVKQYGDRVKTVALDVTQPEQAVRAVQQAVDAFGRIDVLVNNAGYANIDSAEDIPLDDFRAQIDTNFYGVVHVTRAVLPVMRKQRSGRILQISSIGGRRGGTPGLSAYQAAKFAVAGFSEVVLNEVAHLGIQVTIVEPGGFGTDWAGSSMKIYTTQPDYEASVGALNRQIRGNPAAARGVPEKAAKVLLALASMEKQPRRLLLGSDAYVLAKLTLRELGENDEAHRALSASTDADGFPDFADTDVGRAMLKLPRP